jgi:hypothetical protein
VITDVKDEYSTSTGAKLGTRVTVYPDNGPGTSVLVRTTYSNTTPEFVVSQVIPMLQYVVSKDLVSSGDFAAAQLDSFVAALVGPPQMTTAAILAAGGFTASQLPH